MPRPKIASTMLGAPPTISIADSTARASPAGRPYSTSHTAIATPSGPAIAVPIAVTSSVPSIGSRKPPVALCLTSAVGDSNEQRRVKVGEPLDEHEDDDRERQQREADARRPAGPVCEAVRQGPAPLRSRGARATAVGGASSAVAIRCGSRSG